MKIESDQIDQNRRQITKLIKSQRGEIASRQQEVKNIQKMTERVLDNERLQGEVKLMDVQERNKAQLMEATRGNEDKLIELRKQVENTEEKLFKEQAMLQKNHSATINRMNQNHSLKAKELFNNAQEEIKDLNFNVNEKVKDVHAGTNQTLAKLKHKSSLAIDKANYESSLKVNAAQSGQANMLKKLEDRNRLAMRQSEIDHKAKLAEQQFKNQNEFTTKQKIHEDRSKAVEKHYSELAKGEKIAFEKKYNTMVDEQKAVLGRLKDMFDLEYNKTVEAYAKKKEEIEMRAQDSFYNLKTIEPQIREDEKFYYVDIPTPLHEKENYHVTAHGRKIKLSFNRRSEQRMDLQDEVQTSKKSETITREFKVAQIVEDKELKESYQNGVLSYRVPKA